MPRRSQQLAKPRPWHRLLALPGLALPLLGPSLPALRPLGPAPVAMAQPAAPQALRGASPEQQGPEERCPLTTASEPLPPPPGSTALLAAPAPDPLGRDYRHRLRPTAYGWPVRRHWCIWIQPPQQQDAATRWEEAWQIALEQALASWRELVAFTMVQDPERAQLLILRRRPPLRGGRASHGRAELSLVRVRRGDATWQLEPRVLLSLSPGQRPAALQATALHELGHAFGLWGHSDAPGDAMAAVPGAAPVLQLSARDRASILWLMQQPGLEPAPIRPPSPSSGAN